MSLANVVEGEWGINGVNNVIISASWRFRNRWRVSVGQRKSLALPADETVASCAVKADLLGACDAIWKQ